MKLQHLAVIFAIIFLPIILITSYYIQKQVDTIDLQLSYDSKLLDATSDALTAFEVNTANEDLSSVADSLRSIIEASNNIFFNTLATNMGYSNASKSYVQPYVPAILYTLYDGYYIYSPTSSPVVCTDSYGQTVSVGDYGVTGGTTSVSGDSSIGKYYFNQDRVEYANDSTEATGGDTVNYNSLINKEEYGQLLYQNKDGSYSTTLHSNGNDTDTYYTQSYILKSYVSYSANYQTDDINVDINYTLDNFISVTGTIGNVYYTKSGYLIDYDLVDSVTIGGSTISWNLYSEEDIVSLINSDVVITVTLNESDGRTTTISNYETSSNSETNEDVRDAVEYYVKAWMFSSWVYENLSGIKESDITSSGYSLAIGESNAILADINDEVTNQYDNLMYDFSNDNDYIFSENPEDDESNFEEHKRNVIKNSINYNLALAMVTYSEMRSLEEYDLPIFSEEEWDTILSNVSVVSFMQGLNCGLKYYNNYAIATSTNNEITVTPSEIYYVAIKQVANVTYQYEGVEYTEPLYSDITDNYYYETAHRIDCSDLEETDYYISFKSKEIKYDKIYDSDLGRYTYDHKAYLDYNCIVTDNYNLMDSSGNPITDSSGDNVRGNNDLLENLQYLSSNKVKAYRIAIGKERNNLYKSIDYDTNYGYQIDVYTTGQIVSGTSTTVNLDHSTRSVSEIYKIEVVIENTENTTSNVYTDTMTVNIAGVSASVVIPTTSATTRTVEFNVSPSNSSRVNSIIISFNGNTKTTVKEVKIYYK